MSELEGGPGLDEGYGLRDVTGLGGGRAGKKEGRKGLGGREKVRIGQEL